MLENHYLFQFYQLLGRCIQEIEPHTHKKQKHPCSCTKIGTMACPKKSTIQMTINEDLLTYSIINIFHQWKVEGTTRMQSLKLLQLWWLLDLLERFMWNTEFNKLWSTKLKFLWKKSINITWIFKHVITYINRHMCYCHEQNLTWPFWYLSLIWMLVGYICHSSDWVRLLI